MISPDEMTSPSLWEARGIGGRFLLYTGPPTKGSLPRENVCRMARARHAWGAAWSYDWDCGVEGPWYSLVCDEPGYDLDKIKKKVRYYVRRGLEACTLRKLDAEWLAEYGYTCFSKAAARYQGVALPTHDRFRERMLALRDEPGWEIIGAFVADELAAYGIVRRFGRYLQVAVAKFDPGYAEAMPMYALYFTIARDSLASGDCDVVDNGSRPLRHDTNIEEFLLRLGWRKAYARLDLWLAWPMRISLSCIKACGPLCRMVMSKRLTTSLEGLLEADRLSQLTSARPSQQIERRA